LGNFHPLKFLEISNVKLLESSGNFPGKFPVNFTLFGMWKFYKWTLEIQEI